MNLRLDQVTSILLEESKRYLPCSHCKNNTSFKVVMDLETEDGVQKCTGLNWICSVCGAPLYPND